jgi:iron(III) transport system substrate-binding protein
MNRCAGVLLAGVSLALGLAACCAPASAADAPSWLDPKLVDAARAEGALVIYSSINEEEGLPTWHLFEEATGIKVEYIRGSDAQMVARVLIESRGDKPAWDLLTTIAVHKLPQALLAQVEPPEAKHLIAEGRDPDHRWYGISANYDVPSYNTRLVQTADLPRSYEELARRADWANHVANNETDAEWVTALMRYYGEDKGRNLVASLVGTLRPAIISGHLQLARAVGAGEYWASLNNYVSLTLNVKLGGAPIDFWAIDPIALFFHEVGINRNAPHPSAARLAENFLLSREAQQKTTTWGRLPVRHDVPTNPPGVLDAFAGKTVIPVALAGQAEKQADSLYKELVTERPR